MCNCYATCGADFENTVRMVSRARGLKSDDVKEILNQITVTKNDLSKFTRYIAGDAHDVLQIFAHLFLGRPGSEIFQLEMQGSSLCIYVGEKEARRPIVARWGFETQIYDLSQSLSVT